MSIETDYIKFVRNKNKIIAKFCNGDDVLFKASASCHPDDKFNMLTGISLALKRLMIKTNSNNIKVGDIVKSKVPTTGTKNYSYNENLPKDWYCVVKASDGITFSGYPLFEINGFKACFNGLNYDDFEVVCTEGLYSGDAVCIKSVLDGLTVGKIYSFVCGNTKKDTEEWLFERPIRSLKEISDESSGQIEFLEIVK